VKLISLDQAKAHLRVDHDEDDADIDLKIGAASEAILDYLKLPADAYADDSSGEIEFDSDGPVNVPMRVQQAVLLLLGEFYRSRDGQQQGEVPTQWGYGYLPRPVVALLYSMRDPTIS
jgi:hypothetical protein